VTPGHSYTFQFANHTDNTDPGTSVDSYVDDITVG
jgi:hypothetical protein